MLLKLKNGKTCHISNGNLKLGTIPSFNLPPIQACSPDACKTCGHDCYAMKAWRQYHTVRIAYSENLELVKDHLYELEDTLNWFFDSPNAPRFFRLHTSGDFISLEYSLMWYRVILTHPQTKFLIFSKYWDNIRPIKFYELKNCKLYLSDWPGFDIPEDLRALYPIAWIDDGSRPKELFEEASGCPGNCESCFGCWLNSGDVVFKKH